MSQYNLQRQEELLASRVHPLNYWFYKIPAHARRRIEYSFRTTVTTLVCIILTYQLGWSPFASFLSPSNSISSSALHIGTWQKDTFKMLGASLIGSMAGLVVGMTAGYIPLQLVVLFFVLTWVNKCSAWDRGQCAYASQAVILCGSLAGSAFSPLQVTYVSLMVLVVPYMITGVCLLVVFPASAVFTVRAKVIIISRKFSLMTTTMIKAFHTHEYINLYCAEFDQLHAELTTDLKELSNLADVVNNEKIIFWNIIHLPNALCKLHEIYSKMLVELAGLKDAVNMMQFNQTNELFVESMRSALEELDAETEIAFCIVGEYFDAFELVPSKYTQKVIRCCLPLVQGAQWCQAQCQTLCPWLCTWPGSLRGSHNHKKKDDDQGDAGEGERLQTDKQWDIEMEGSIKNREHRGTSNAYNLHVKEMYGVQSSLSLMKKLNEKKRASGSFPGFEEGSDDGSSTHLSDYRLSSHAGSAERGKKKNKHQHKHKKVETSEEDDYRKGMVGELEMNPVRSEAVIKDLETHTEKRPSDKTDSNTDDEEEEEENPDDKTDKRNKKLRSDYGECIDQLFETRTMLISAYSRTRAQYVDITCTDSTQDAANQSRVPFEPTTPGYSTKSLVLESDKSKIVTEHVRLGSKNINPRDVYLHRLSVIVESVAELQDVFHLTGSYWNPMAFCLTCWNAIMSYFYICCKNAPDSYAEVEAVFKTAKTPSEQWNDLLHLLFSWFKGYSGSVKLALAIVFATSLVLYELSPQFGLTSVFVIVFIKQEHLSSAFLKSYQRIEGTVAGAVFAFGCLQAFKCTDGLCGATTMIPLMMAWLALCMLFIEGKRHGYAAYVASYTPMILIIGNTAGTSVAWTRVAQTFIGVAIYLLFDNLILPIRTYDFVKVSVLECINATRVMYCDSVFAIDDLINLERMVASEPLGSTPIGDYTTMKKPSGGKHSPFMVSGSASLSPPTDDHTVKQKAGTRVVPEADVDAAEVTSPEETKSPRGDSTPITTAAGVASPPLVVSPPTATTSPPQITPPSILTREGSRRDVSGLPPMGRPGRASSVLSILGPPVRQRTESSSTRHSGGSKMTNASNFMYRPMVGSGLEDLKEIVARRRQNSVVDVRTTAGITIERHRTMSIVAVNPAEQVGRLDRSYSINMASGSRSRRVSNAGSPRSPAIHIRLSTDSHDGGGGGGGGGGTPTPRRSPRTPLRPEAVVRAASDDAEHPERVMSDDSLPASAKSPPTITRAQFALSQSDSIELSSSATQSRDAFMRGPLETVLEADSRDGSDPTTSPPVSDHQKKLSIGAPDDEVRSSFGMSAREAITSPRERFKEAFIQCNVHLADAQDQLKLMNTQLTKQALLLSLVIHEPELCYKIFPLAEYERLLNCFLKVARSGRAVNEGCMQFSIVLVQMIEKHEDVSLHLNLFAFMSNHLFLITEKVDDALILAHEALSRVYFKNDYDAELSAILVLSQHTDALLAAVDEHFRGVFVKQAGQMNSLEMLNPYFTLAWVNVFESMRYLMMHLSELGMALHSIKNVEALMSL